MDAPRRVQEIAARQRGLVRRSQLPDELSRGHLRRLLREGALTKLTPQVFLVGMARPTWQQQATAAVWQAGRTAVLSHGAAAWAHRLHNFGPGAIEVSVAEDRAVPRKTIGLVHRGLRLAESTIIVDGLATTSIARTITDLAPRFGTVLLRECLEDTCRRGLLRLPDQLGEFDLRNRPGMGPLRVALEEACTADIDSWLEQRYFSLVRSWGLPEPATQVEVVGEGWTYTVDFMWGRRLIVETDGWGTHSTRTEQNRDAEQRTRLTTMGYTVLVFTRDQVLHDPEHVRRHTVLALRGLGLLEPAA